MRVEEIPEVLAFHGANFPVKHKTAMINSVKIFYREAGSQEAPVILLLHGFPSSSRMFATLLPLLSAQFRVIAPDYPGFGHSEAPPPELFSYTFDNLADCGARTIRFLLSRVPWPSDATSPILKFIS
jgi:pimeloyl-ACP methyl ester carboxylesterase